MKVLFDHQSFSWQKIGGISRYIVEIARHMPADVEPAFTPGLLSECVYLDQLPAGMAPYHSWRFANYRVRKKLYEAVGRIRSRRALSSGGIDVLHPTYYDPYFLCRRKVPYVITVHDFTHERFPDMLPDSRRVIPAKRRTVEEADAIIAISENTASDLTEFYGIPRERIDVIHHGYTPLSAQSPEPVAGLPGEFTLFVGERGRYKNFSRFAEAFAIVATQMPDMGMVCAGRPFSADETALLRRLGIEGRSMSVFATPGMLDYMYSKAACFVYPSLYEGFGLPVLEAYSASCPTVLARASCLPEIGADGALYFDPLDPADMASAIITASTDADVRAHIREAAAKRLTDFSWQRTAEATADVYRRISNR